MEVVFRQRIRWLYATNFDYQNQKGFTRTEAEIINAYDERSHMDPSKRTRLFMFLFRIFFAPFFLVAWVGWVSNLFNFNRSFASFASLCGKFFFRESPRRSFFFCHFWLFRSTVEPSGALKSLHHALFAPPNKLGIESFQSPRKRGFLNDEQCGYHLLNMNICYISQGVSSQLSCLEYLNLSFGGSTFTYMV